MCFLSCPDDAFDAILERAQHSSSIEGCRWDHLFHARRTVGGKTSSFQSFVISSRSMTRLTSSSVPSRGPTRTLVTDSLGRRGRRTAMVHSIECCVPSLALGRRRPRVPPPGGRFKPIAASACCESNSTLGLSRLPEIASSGSKEDARMFPIARASRGRRRPGVHA